MARTALSGEQAGGPVAKKKTDRFSVVKAVKENARERVGTPPPSTPIPDRRHKAEHGPEKHKGRLRERLQRLAEGQEPGE